mgnify:CR=1 FL=1
MTTEAHDERDLSFERVVPLGTDALWRGWTEPSILVKWFCPAPWVTTEAEALDRARDAAAGMDVRIGGGATTVRQYLQAGLIDELHLVSVPILVGHGERLFDGRRDRLAGALLEIAHRTERNVGVEEVRQHLFDHALGHAIGAGADGGH